MKTDAIDILVSQEIERLASMGYKCSVTPEYYDHVSSSHDLGNDVLVGYINLSSTETSSKEEKCTLCSRGHGYQLTVVGDTSKGMQFHNHPVVLRRHALCRMSNSPITGVSGSFLRIHPYK